METLGLPHKKSRIPSLFRVTFALIMREMATSYGKSYLGYVWAVLEPLGAIVILSLVFSVALKAPALGDSFPLFYASGYVPFVAYNSMQNKISAALRENTQLLFYPRVTYLDAILARFILTFVTQLLVAVIVFSGIFLIEGSSQRIDIINILEAMVVASYLGLGVGTLNCVIIHLSPSWRQMWSILTRPLFLISCIFYMYDTLPEWVQDILWYNPLVHVVGLARTGFYSVYDGDYIFVPFPILIGSVTLFLGFALLRRFARDLMNA